MNFAALVLGFREGLEAFLILSLSFSTLRQLKSNVLQPYLWYGTLVGILISALGGWGLHLASQEISNSAEIWESVFSFTAVVLITTLILWMIRHSHDMKAYIKKELDDALTHWGVLSFAAVIVMREGAEIALFSIAGNYDVLSLGVGVLLALALTLLLYFSLVKVPLKHIFRITLVYLILQAAYLLGYSIHEGLEALEGIMLSEDHWIFQKAFDLSGGILDHKNGAIGLPLNILLGWYSKPEWITMIFHYSYAIGIFYTWQKRGHRS